VKKARKYKKSHLFVWRIRYIFASLFSKLYLRHSKSKRGPRFHVNICFTYYSYL